MTFLYAFVLFGVFVVVVDFWGGLVGLVLLFGGVFGFVFLGREVISRQGFTVKAMAVWKPTVHQADLKPRNLSLPPKC